MVVFTCNACGESVKKAQVEKHVNICRNCQCLSCMDCGKDFWGDDYKEHVKCVSEDQKYGGKDFEAKTNKGDAKQQEWIQKIHEVMKKPNISPKVRNILEQMRVFDNIPRKKAKFQISSEKEQDKPKQQEGRQSAETGEKAMPEENGITDDKIEKKKNKRERKEERQKNKKKEKKDLKLENQSEVKKSKKSKKGKESSENDLEINGNDHQTETEEETNVKKRKRKHAEVPSLEEPHITRKRMKTESISEDVGTENTNGNEENVGMDKGKFNWKGTIKAVLKQAPDNEISIKKLRKKVIAQYYAVAGEHHKSEEDILVIFNKKVNNNPKFKVLKDKVKLLK
ncbi:cell growth-regulating nucleolar protein isoform X2 [Chroicocephalus ridibundus]|uniref:cell growth-regulating nucleolar protein isoform X2 n=1 Tax=Chroicocephalus ridibundus TaxID=1192867 RepID=UPI002FDDEAD9